MVLSEQLSMFSPKVLPTKIGNTKLIEYGIFQEKTDYRIHVCGLSNVCYVFETKNMVDFIKENRQNLKEISVTSYDQITAKGYLVSILTFLQRGIGKEYVLPTSIWNPVYKGTNEKNKGIWAVGIAKKAIENNFISFNYVVKEEENIVKQIQGQDLLLVNKELKVQVKCDLRACLKSLNNEGTGNLFIQTWECNPTKQF